MVLTVDVGNTNIKLGGFEEEQLIFSAAIATQTQYTADDYACSLLRVFDLYQVLPAQVQSWYSNKHSSA
ncbi:MAG: type III pantothenate kinase [Oscillospiraceae bacterium]